MGRDWQPDEPLYLYTFAYVCLAMSLWYLLEPKSEDTHTALGGETYDDEIYNWTIYKPDSPDASKHIFWTMVFVALAIPAAWKLEGYSGGTRDDHAIKLWLTFIYIGHFLATYLVHKAHDGSTVSHSATFLRFVLMAGGWSVHAYLMSNDKNDQFRVWGILSFLVMFSIGLAAAHHYKIETPVATAKFSRYLLLAACIVGVIGAGVSSIRAPCV